MMEILKGRRECYENELCKSSTDISRREAEAKIQELDNLMFIISAQVVTELQ